MAGLLTEPEELEKVQKSCLFLLVEYNELIVNTQRFTELKRRMEGRRAFGLVSQGNLLGRADTSPFACTIIWHESVSLFPVLT